MKMVTTGAFLAMALVGCAATTTTDNRMALSGYNYIEEGDLSAAERELNSALDVNPNNPYALLNLGVVYEKTGRTSDAREMYTRVLDLDSQDTADEATDGAYQGETLATIARENLTSLR